jgi:tetratricopeptide (TPR) repeat protein
LLRYAYELAERCGTEQARTHATWAEGLALYGAGQFHAAVENLGRCLEPNDATIERLEIRWVMIRALGWLGRYDDLRRLQQEGLRDALSRGDVYAAIVLRLGTASLVWLADDRTDLAERHVSEAMQEWSTLSSGSEHHPSSTAALRGGNVDLNCFPQLRSGPVGSMISRTLLHLYQGNAELAHTTADDWANGTNLEAPCFIGTLHRLQLRASSALAMLDLNLGSPQALLREVERDARALASGGSWSGLATAFRAALALRRGSRADALAGLRRAAREFDAAHMKSYAAAARDRAARLRDDGSSAAEIANAAEVLRAEGVASPERMIAMLLPGFGV